MTLVEVSVVLAITVVAFCCPLLVIGLGLAWCLNTWLETLELQGTGDNVGIPSTLFCVVFLASILMGTPLLGAILGLTTAHVVAVLLEAENEVKFSEQKEITLDKSLYRVTKE